MRLKPSARPVPASFLKSIEDIEARLLKGMNYKLFRSRAFARLHQIYRGIHDLAPSFDWKKDFSRSRFHQIFDRFVWETYRELWLRKEHGRPAHYDLGEGSHNIIYQEIELAPLTVRLILSADFVAGRANWHWEIIIWVAPGKKSPFTKPIRKRAKRSDVYDEHRVSPYPEDRLKIMILNLKNPQGG